MRAHSSHTNQTLIQTKVEHMLRVRVRASLTLLLQAPEPWARVTLAHLQ